MPYKVKKSGRKYVVAKAASGKIAKHSGHFGSKAAAVRQMRAMYAHEKKR